MAPKHQNVGDILSYKTSLRGPQREWDSAMGISYRRGPKEEKTSLL